MYYSIGQVPEAVQLSVCRAYKGGDSMKNAGYGHDCAPKVVRSILVKHKIPLRKRGYVVDKKGRTVHITAVCRGKTSRATAMRTLPKQKTRARPPKPAASVTPAQNGNGTVNDGGLSMLRALVNNGLVTKQVVLSLAGEFLHQ